MKSKIYTFVALLATIITGNLTATGQQAGMAYDTIYMGASYKNEVYYSMSAGNQGAVDRKQWDIAFRANWMSASILTNDGVGVELYTYPKSDTSGWLAVDTAGIKNWKKMVNSTTDWETGAFCQNQIKHPDYGWGVYDNFTHSVVGDSLFIIKLLDGSFRKLWIIQKISSDNAFEIRFAKLDGTDDTKALVDCAPYAAKNFVGYSITSKQVVDFEPVISSKWDILFTKYVYTYPVGSPNYGSIYTVTGVLSNYKVKVTKLEHVSTDTIVAGLPAMDGSRSPIGWEWKTFSGSFKVTDSLVYFVQDISGTIHRLIFKEFKGSSTGRIVLEKGLNTFTGVNENPKSGFNAAVYPNPVNEVMNLVINPGKARFAVVSLLDISGRTVLSKRYDIQAEELSTLQIPVSELPSGIYMVKIQAGGNVISRKVIVNN